MGSRAICLNTLFPSQAVSSHWFLISCSTHSKCPPSAAQSNGGHSFRFLENYSLQWRHNGAIASQITSLVVVYSAVWFGADQRKHQSSTSLAFARGIHRGPVGKFPAQRASNLENVFIWWRHHVHILPPITAYWQKQHCCVKCKQFVVDLELSISIVSDQKYRILARIISWTFANHACLLDVTHTL